MADVPNPISSNQSDNFVAVPWVAQNDSFFTPIQIDGSRWNRLFPYRLLVIDVNNGNAIVPRDTQTQDSTGSGLGSSLSNTVNIALKAGGNRPGTSFLGITNPFDPAIGGTLDFVEIGNQWLFQLPITPQQLQISTPYAITTTPTLTGIVEEHGGVRFKMITASGSMGVLPYNKATIGESPSTGLFGFASGTIQNAKNIVTQLKNTIGAFTANGSGGVVPEVLESTGYAQALLLDQFLEQYAEAKRNPKNAGWRLVFDIPKQNQSFIVTPVQFNWIQSIESPGEIKYSLQFKAWRRIDLLKNKVKNPVPLPNVSASVLTRIKQSLSNAQSAVAAAYDTVGAVKGDVSQVTNIYRNIALLVNSIGNFPATVGVLTKQTISSIKSDVAESTAILTGNSNFPQSPTNLYTFSGKYSTGLNQVGAQAGTNFTTSASDNLSNATNTVNQFNSQSQGLSYDALVGGQNGQDAAFQAQTDPMNEIFNNPDRYPEFFNSINISDLTLSPEKQRQISEYLDGGMDITIDDLLLYKAQLLNTAELIANSFGAGNETFSYIYGLPDATTVREMSIEENDLLVSIYNVIQGIDNLTATQQIDDGRIMNSFGYVAEVAQANDINFTVPTAKVRVPVPFGLNIEEISARYLGDPNRWLEIATLNDLEEPYIDETGFIRPLLSNAQGRQINIASDENLYVNQAVIISSNSIPASRRRIISIEKINDTNYLITLDGDDNLDNYTLADNAKIKAYLSGTVNSQGQIYIPVAQTAPEDIRTRSIPAFAGDPLVGLSKVDWLLADNGDLARDAFGDFRLSGGLNNIIQPLRIMFSTAQGKNLAHPNFGAQVPYGTNIADTNAKQIYNQIRSAVLADPRYGSILRLTLNLKGNTLTINMAVTVANGNGVLPLTFNVDV